VGSLESATAALAPFVTPVRLIASAVVAIALPLFLITSGVRWVALGESFYMDEFARYRVGQVTSLPNDELARVAHAFVTYFQAEPGRMDVIVNTPSGPQPLFSEREIQHMVDVQALMQRIFQVWMLALVALIVGGIAIVAVEPATGWRALVRAAAIGGGLAILLVGLLGVGSLLDFSQLFYQFHLLSFSNDLWLLDPSRDRLIQLFPLGFFYDAAIRIAVQTVVVGIVILAVSLSTLRGMR
jgi:integral membrane protein (TIGR01906 family)